MTKDDFSQKKKCVWLIYLGAFIVSSVLTFRFAREILTLPNADLIAWDQAARADEAVRLAKEIYHFQIGQFIFHVLSLNWWPPALPLIMFPFSLILGPSFSALVLPIFMAFPLTVVSLLFLYRNLDGAGEKNKILGFSIVFFLALTSPFLLSSSSWVMLEIHGILLTCLCLGFYFRARREERMISYKICAILVFLLWTLKYSYGLFVLVVFLFFELSRNWAWFHRQLFSFRTLRFLIRPLVFPAYLLLLVILFIMISPGKELRCFGVALSIGNIYNPLMYLYLYLFGVFLFLLKKNWLRIKAHLRTGQRELLLWGMLPTGLFIALPDKIKAIIKNFEAGRRGESGFSFDPLLYYLRSIGKDYSIFFPVGIIVIFLCFIGLLKIKKAPLGVRFLLLFFSLGCISLSLTFNLVESRIIAIFVPGLWIISAWTADSLFLDWPKKYRIALAVGISFIAFCLALFSPLLLNKAKKQPCARHASAFRKLIDPVIQMSRDTHYVYVSGSEDLGFSLLLKWKLESSHYKQKFFKIEFSDERTDAFQDLIKNAPSDLVVLFVVEGSERSARLEKWQAILLASENYKLAGEEFLKEPGPVHIIFFRREKIE